MTSVLLYTGSPSCARLPGYDPGSPSAHRGSSALRTTAFTVSTLLDMCDSTRPQNQLEIVTQVCVGANIALRVHWLLIDRRFMARCINT